MINIVKLGLLASAVLLVSARKPATFCPGAKPGDLCLSQAPAVKCGVFYNYLFSDRELIWIGALPDALKDKKPEEREELLPGVDPDSFNEVDAGSGNSKCYTTFLDLANQNLDTCNKNVLNRQFTGTIGDQLCQQAARFMKNEPEYDDAFNNGLRNIELVLRYSEHGDNWKPITSNGAPLTVNQRLCCDFQSVPIQYNRCDGGVTNHDC